MGKPVRYIQPKTVVLDPFEVPRLPERFIKLKVGSVLSLEKVEVVPKKLTFNQKIKNIFKRNE